MTARSSRANGSEAADGIVVRSDDGAIAYKLRRTALGLFVERHRRQPSARARLTQTAVFRTADGFLRWCNADSIRFDYPMVFSAMRREADSFFDSDDDSNSTAG
jgi:hypothetical protein